MTSHVHQQGMLILRDDRQELVLLARTNDRNWLTGVSIPGHPQELTDESDEPVIVLSMRGCRTPLVIESAEVGFMLARWIEHAAEWMGFIDEVGSGD